MLLKKIDIYGFKSFADRVKMEFNQGITAIVGPNGSGKSNVADAVRWVLGEQSAKTLRGSKMEDVIFSGTQIRKPLGFAEVSLTFDNSSGMLPIDYSEVTVTRRVFRSGESEYYINRGACRLKDIVELFMDTGIGKEGYSIIGQGRIDEILSNRPEERRYIFEEAAGIVKYKSRREESEKKLEKTKANLLRVDDILSELEQQLEPLEEQAKKAKEYLNYREQLKVLEINQFIDQFNKHTAKIQDLNVQIETLEGDILLQKNMYSSKENDKLEDNDKLAELSGSIDQMKNKRHELLNRSEQLKGQINLEEEKLKQLVRDNHRLESDIKQLHDEYNEKNTRMESHKALHQKKQTEIDEYDNELKRTSMELAKIEEELAKHKSSVEANKNSIIEAINKISQHNNALTRYNTMINSFRERLVSVLESLEKYDEYKQQLTAVKAGLDEEFNTWKGKYENLLKEQGTLESSLRQQKEELNVKTSQLQKDRQLQEGVRSRLNVLNDMKKGYEGFQRSVKAILTSCSKNAEISKKVCGVVADLISVPKGYELAIETALGASLQHIVTEQEYDAKLLIEYLRNNKLGRATFLPISSIQGRYLSSYENQVLNMNGCVGIASQLIECDTKYRSIIDNLLGRVIVAENMDTAIEMARRFSYKFKIVTLEGDVINPGGSMTGGSAVNKGISILSRNREIGELMDKMSFYNEKINSLLKDIDNLSTSYSNDKDALKELDIKIKEMEASKSAIMEKLNRVEIQIQQQDTEREKLQLEKSQINENIEQLYVKVEEIELSLQELQLTKDNISQHVEEFEQTLKEETKKKEEMSGVLSDLRVKAAGLESEIRAIYEEIKTLDNDLERYKNNIANRRNEIEGNLNRIQQIKISKERYNNEIQNTKQMADKLEEEIREKENLRAELEASIRETEKEMKELSSTIDDLTNRKHRFDVQKSRLEVELESYQNSIWDEYSLTYAGALQYKDDSVNLTRVKSDIKTLKESISKLGDVNVNAIEEFKKVSERYKFLTEQRQDLINAKDNLLCVIDEIVKTMEERFKSEFKIINEYFDETFKMLFSGGHAKLVLEDENNVLSCGIDIVAQPPGKRLQSLSLLSGGERAMTAIALLFAILRHKPTSFCVLDEIDAALDESNVGQFSNYIKKLSSDTQFIIITHRKGTMEVCDILYGIAMEEKGVSKLISVKMEKDAS